MAAKEPGVVHAEDYQYMCSEAGQAKIINAIHEKNLTGIVVCSCSPRMHEATFRKAAQKAGLNPYMVEIANIREHCSWIHKDMEEATLKAVIPVSYTHLIWKYPKCSRKNQGDFRSKSPEMHEMRQMLRNLSCI